MSKIVISVEMTFTNETEEKVLLTKVVNALQEDITERYTDFCKKNNFDITLKPDIERAAIPFIKELENYLP
jgi:hypothetical protein